MTSIVWLDNKILCSGWHRCVTEFSESEIGMHKKSWEIRHSDDIVCSSVRYPEALVTASYNGEIVLWRLETGQPYRRYQVSNPTGRYVIHYNKRNRGNAIEDKENSSEAGQPAPWMTSRNVAITAVRFLNKRTTEPDTGTFLVALESGLVQVWSHHPSMGFLGAFSAIHVQRDFVNVLETDPEDKFLITG